MPWCWHSTRSGCGGWPPPRPVSGARTRWVRRGYPETAALAVVHDEWVVEADCVLVGLEPWRSRPGVRTPDPRVLLAGDAVRCDLPVALMERAATTGWMAADHLLSGWGLRG